MNETVDGAEIRDPVCGMPIRPETAAATLRRDDEDLYFCSVQCARRYEEAEQAAQHGSRSDARIV